MNNTANTVALSAEKEPASLEIVLKDKKLIGFTLDQLIANTAADSMYCELTYGPRGWDFEYGVHHNDTLEDLKVTGTGVDMMDAIQIIHTIKNFPDFDDDFAADILEMLTEITSGKCFTERLFTFFPFLEDITIKEQ